MTKEELKLIPQMDRYIKIKLQEIKELEEMSECIPALKTEEKVKTSVQNKSMDLVVKIADLKKETEKECNRLVELKKEARRLINSLDGKERILMDLRYIGGEEWKEVAYVLDWSIRHTLRVHGWILAKFFKNVT